ncbi:hypothetical protein KJ951_01070 [Patescibacteria group bacterium]|nr:hypothetical protein [Patescibacteria group bacterium]MBU1702971.1 hypothetical protein [Patescibacteria group bacterium]MBU1954003.1 hypothetical protein [Patescibacteria group bacterium]
MKKPTPDGRNPNAVIEDETTSEYDAPDNELDGSSDGDRPTMDFSQDRQTIEVNPNSGGVQIFTDFPPASLAAPRSTAAPASIIPEPTPPPAHGAFNRQRKSNTPQPLPPPNPPPRRTSSWPKSLHPSSNPPPPPPSDPSIITLVDELPENPEINTFPAAFFCDDRGNPVSVPMPLFNRSNSPKNDEYIFTIGKDPSCDIRITSESHPDLYTQIGDFHGEIKIKGDKIWGKSNQGPLFKPESGEILTTEQWTQLAPGQMLRVLPQKKSQAQTGTSRPGRINITITPAYQLFTEDPAEKEEARRALRDRAVELIKHRQSLIRAKGPQSEEALQISQMLEQLLLFEREHQLGFITAPLASEIKNHFQQYRQTVESMKEEIRGAIEEQLGIIYGLEENDRLRLERLVRVEQQIMLRAVGEGIAVLHVAEGEDPLDKNLAVLFKRPVFSVRTCGSGEGEWEPFLVPSITFGSHKVCHKELKHEVAPFMAELYTVEDGKGNYRFFVKMLHANVKILTDEGENPPPSETFEIKPGEVLKLGNHVVKVDARMHGYSYNAVKPLLLGDPFCSYFLGKGIITELLERIEDQEYTTDKQKMEAQNAIGTILMEVLGSNVPEEEKARIVLFCRNKYEEIFDWIWDRICAWGEENLTADSGHFQTILMLNRAGMEKQPFSPEKYWIDYPQIRGQALARTQRYAQSALAVSKKISLGTRLLPDNRRGRAEIAKREKDREIANMGAVEIARFREMGLIGEEDLKALNAPPEFEKTITYILEIRKSIAALESDDKISVIDLQKLYWKCRGFNLGEIFTPEEIIVEGLYMDQNLQSADSAQDYIKQMAVSYARRALTRLAGNTPLKDANNDNIFIINLVEAGILKLTDLVEKRGRFTTVEEIEDLMAAKEAAIREEELTRRATKMTAAREQKEMMQLLKSMNHLHTILLRSRAEINLGNFLGMCSFAELAGNKQLRQRISRPEYNITLSGGEITVLGDRSKISAVDSAKSWEDYFSEWDQLFIKMAAHLAGEACAGVREANIYTEVIKDCIEKGFFSFDQLGVTAAEMQRGVEAEIFMQKAMKNLDDFTYLTLNLTLKVENSTLEVKFWDEIKERITKAKLKAMLAEYRKGDPENSLDPLRLRYERKIRVLQRKDSRATAMLDELFINDEERALLQLGG